MVLSDSLFFAIFPAFVAIYYLTPTRQLQATVLVLASIGFLAMFGALHASFAIGIVVLVWATGWLLERSGYEDQWPVAAVLLTSLVLIKSPFLFGKGQNPIGASYYIFVLLSIIWFLPKRLSLTTAARTVFFFPHLIAGPISRATMFLPQLERRKRFQLRNIVIGAQMVAFGLAKKVLIADSIALSIAPVWSNPEHYSTGALWLTVFAFYIQLYADFSGYTDIARGVARILGYRLPINFRAPYLASTPMEFWRRWHISLSTWIRLYLYTPISIQVWRRLRSRRAIGPATLAIAILTMVIVGLWHEISLRFFAFGVIHGAAIGVWFMVLGEKGKVSGAAAVLSWALFQFLLMLSLILFRSSDWSAMGTMIVRMFSGGSGDSMGAIVPGLFVAALIVFLLQWIELHATRKKVAVYLLPLRYSVPVFPLAVVGVCCVIFFTGMSIEGIWVSPHDPFFFRENIQFIYAQF